MFKQPPRAFYVCQMMWIHVSLDMVFSRMNIQWYGIVFALSAKQYLFGWDRRFSATAPCEGWHIAQDWFLNYFKVAYVSPTYVWHQHHLSLFRFVKSICSSLMASLRISRAYCFKMIEGNLSCNSHVLFEGSPGAEICTRQCHFYRHLRAL